MILEIIFWIFLGLIIYTYLGYGIVLYGISRFRSVPVKKAEITPKVTLIITAYNEEKSICAKLENLLALDYPKEKIEIIVGSDASTDKTDALVQQYAQQDVKLIRVEGRKGKTEVQNQCVSQAVGDIIVFTDATTYLAADSVRNMMKNFADESVGCVGGKLIYKNIGDNQIGKGGTSYWSYETFIKKLESSVNSLIGVSGCFYGLRKELYEPIPRHLISDFVVALNTYQKGYRVIYDDAAISIEETLGDARDELDMRVRVALRTYTALFEKRELLNPIKSGFYAFQLISHKVFRYAVGLFMIGMFISNLFILHSAVYLLFMALQLLFYSVGIVSHYVFKAKNNKNLLSIPYYLILVNLAALIAFWRFLKGEKAIIWEPKR